MNADRVHAAVARCLTDPSFLSAALTHARTSSDALLGAAELERLALFAGFITKIKHNPLRITLPYTLRLLALLGEEVRFFSFLSDAYLLERANGPLPLARQRDLLEQRLHAFLVDHPARIRMLLDDIVTHETTAHRLGSENDEHIATSDPDQIRLRGCFAFMRYRIDVLHVCDALLKRRFDLDIDLIERDHVLAYWKPAHINEVSFFEVDELTALLFSLAAEGRTLSDIAAALAARGLEAITMSEIEVFFAEAMQRGFVHENSTACA